MKKHLFFIEIFAFYLFISLINWSLFPQLLGFLDVDPHPFWIGVLLFGFRYGVAAGLTSGIVSAVVYMAAAWASGERYRFEELNFYILPSFFMVFGVLVGVFTARHREEAVQLRQENEGIKKEKAGLVGEIKTIQEINRGLEKKIVTRMSTLITLYEGARRLESMSLEELYPSILEFISKTIEAEEASLYLKDEKGWMLAHKYGWKEFQRRPVQIKRGEGIIGLAGNSEKIVSIRDFVGPGRNLLDLPDFMGDALLAGPVRASDKGDVIGVLSIHKMPFFNFNSASVNLFSFLLDWASRSIGRVRYVEQLKDQEVIDPDLKVYSSRYFEGRVRQEFLRSKTYYLPLSIGLVRVERIQYLSSRKKKACMIMLSRLLVESSREMDVVALFKDASVPFAILWITANDKQACEMSDKILAQFKKIDMGDFAEKIDLRIGIASFTPKMEDEESLFKEAREALNR